jgi:hypothetical protein
MKYKVTVTINLIFGLFLIFGCVRKKRENVELPIIDIVEGIESDITKMLLTEVFEDITFIPLETTDECLIGSIGGLRFFKDYILTLDSEQILLFDRAGKFIRKIGSRGQGPCEYQNPYLWDMADDELFVWDNVLNTTLCYDLRTGKCLRTKKHDASFNPIVMTCLNDSVLCYYCDAPDKEPDKVLRIHTLSRDFTKTTDIPIQGEYAEKDIEGEFIGNVQIITYTNAHFFKDGVLHEWNYRLGTVFRITENFEKIPAYKIFLGNHDKNSKKSRFTIQSIKETDRFLFIDGVFGEERYVKKILYDKTTGTSKSLKIVLTGKDGGFHNDIDGSIPFWPNGCISQNVLWEDVTPSRLKELMSISSLMSIEAKNKEKHRAIKNYLDSAREDDNPIIFLVTIKTE